MTLAHDVFISYSSVDKPVADAACARLEAAGIRCWIAPRDITPGTDWSISIVDAIVAARVMVLVFSSHANASEQVKREVERAVSKGLAIVPIRIEDVTPARGLDYFLSTPHWLDAMTPPLEQHLDYLAQSVGFLLERNPAPPPARPASAAAIRRPPMSTGGPGTRTLLIVGGGAVVVLAIIVVVLLTSRGGGSASAGPGGTVVAAGVDPKLVGAWRTTSNFDSLNLTWTVTVAAAGTYASKIAFVESGTYRTDDQTIYLKPTGQQDERTSFWQPQGDTVPVANLEPFSLLTFDQQWAGAVHVAVIPSNGQGKSVWKRTATPAEGETWTHFRDVGGVGISLNETLDLDHSGIYRLTMTNDDNGTITASNGSWKTVSTGAGILDAKYGFVDDNHIALDWAGGNRTWTRVKP